MLRDRTLIARSALELLTIVAGVLIALAVNDWSANRSNRSLEREYLERLQVELRSDSSLTYATLFPRLKTKAAALDTVQQTVLVGKPIADTLAFMRAVGRGRILGFAGGYTSHATFDEMNATGSLRLIENPELRSKIVELYNDAAVEELRINARMSGYALYVHSLLPGSNDAITMDQLHASGTTRVMNGLQSEDFKRRLMGEVNFSNSLRQIIADMAAKRDSLLPRVNPALEQR